MKILLSLRNKLLLSLIVFTGGIWLQSCSEKTNFNPAFSADLGVVLTKVASFETEPSGMTGNKQTFVLFATKSDQKVLEKATSGSFAGTGLSWRQGKSEELMQILRYFQPYETYQNLYPRITNMLNSADLRYACPQLLISNRGVEYASIWVCSPSRHEVAYLSGF